MDGSDDVTQRAAIFRRHEARQRDAARKKVKLVRMATERLLSLLLDILLVSRSRSARSSVTRRAAHAHFTACARTFLLSR